VLLFFGDENIEQSLLYYTIVSQQTLYWFHRVLLASLHDT